jgi:hypothetical protein
MPGPTAKKLGVLIVHGIGNQPSDFATELIEELSERLDDAGLKPRQIAFRPVWWAPVIQPREDEMWRVMKAGGDLDFQSLRRFVLSSLGDAVAYQQSPGAFNTTYDRIHAFVHGEVQTLRKALGDADKPLVVMAHSLGCAILSNYIWDRQKGRDAPAFGATAFERMETLAGMITFGCNIPLFTLAYQKVESIEFPAPQLAGLFPALMPVARWLNFYDPDDILGWPLKPLGEFNNDPASPRRYDRAVSEDIAINVGGLFSAWNPASHSNYWTDDDFTRPAAKLLGELLSRL